MSDLEDLHDQEYPADAANEWKIDNLPNRLTIFRMLLIPIILLSLLLIHYEVKAFVNHHTLLGYIAAWTFVLAAITDFFDGYIARKRKIVTVFGSFLDPIADKFLVVSSLILLQGLHRIPVIVVVVLVLREMYITSLRLLATQKNLQVPVGSFGKWKTVFQMIGIPMLMAYDYPLGLSFPLVGKGFIYLACLFSIYSAIQYSINLIKKVKAKKALRKQKP